MRGRLVSDPVEHRCSHGIHVFIRPTDSDFDDFIDEKPLKTAEQRKG